MIKIISGWSNPGGSTTAFINLTNELNKYGYDTIFYGPHPWHLNKCKSEQLQNRRLKLDPTDTIIIHFSNKLQVRPHVKKIILSCHEQNIFPLQQINYKIFDKIHYVSEHQYKYHQLNHPHFIIPNIIPVINSNNIPTKIAGIVGSIDKNKAVHISIEKALQDNCEKVYIFGTINDFEYWNNYVKKYVDNERVVYAGYQEDRQKMYDMFSDLYFSSELECAPYVLAEAKLAGKTLHVIDGKNYLNTIYEYDTDKIIKTWVKELEL